MKMIGKLQSNRGHKKIDYLISISSNEIEVFKEMFLNTSSINKVFKNKENSISNTFINIRRFLRLIK